jgi:hypothetical protein
VPEDNFALGVLKVLVEAHTVAALAQDAGQRGFADLNGLAPHGAAQPFRPQQQGWR